MSDIIRFNCRGTIIETRRTTILESTVGSIIKDMLSDTNDDTNDDKPIELDENPALFQCILDYHKYNCVERPLFINPTIWDQMGKYYCLDIKSYGIRIPKPSKKYTQQQFINFITQCFHIFYDKTVKAPFRIITEDDCKTLFRSGIYQPLSINNKISFPLVIKDNRSILACNIEGSEFINGDEYMTNRVINLYSSIRNDPIMYRSLIYKYLDKFNISQEYYSIECNKNKRIVYMITDNGFQYIGGMPVSSMNDINIYPYPDIAEEFLKQFIY
jgi:Txe/YoeB family toxin of Txe-Axe toxin-antitoxin module